jgi:hypothetical protein
MRRLNVQFSQIDECIRKSLFALPTLPRNPPLRKGEPLLLQLVLSDARPMGKEDSRIEFALIFDAVEEDRTGDVSRQHWPDADRTWRYILHCSETVPTIPFSLENLNLAHDYSGQATAVYIKPQDEGKIRPLLKGGTPPVELWSVASVEELLRAIRNYDDVLRLSPSGTGTVVREHRRRQPDTWLPDVLKRFYNHRCQICLHDFEPRYGVPHADTRRLPDREAEDPPRSRDLVVVCPNHHGIIGAAGASFNRRSLAFAYPNGLVEKVTLRDHLLLPSA